MLMLFLTIMLLAVAAVFGINTQRVGDDPELAGILAQHMSAWHRAAVETCINDGCNLGSVNVYERLPAQIRAGSLATTGSFVTRYDPAQRLLVTWAGTPTLNRNGVSAETIAGAMSDVADHGHATGYGRFDLAGRRVVGNYVRAANGGIAAVQSIPQPIGGVWPPDNVPIIATRM